MSDVDFLDNALDHISSTTADIDEKIRRLHKAIKDIETNQSKYMDEILKIKKPSLGTSWEGKRGKSFNKSRNRAYKAMKDVLDNDYEDRIGSIETKISSLELEKSFLAATRTMIGTADSLLEKGEEVATEVGHYISQISRRLFG